jgi:hypothetical protein
VLSQGYNHDDIRRLQAKQELVRVSRGAWAGPEVAPLAVAAQHAASWWCTELHWTSAMSR